MLWLETNPKIGDSGDDASLCSRHWAWWLTQTTSLMHTSTPWGRHFLRFTDEPQRCREAKQPSSRPHAAPLEPVHSEWPVFSSNECHVWAQTVRGTFESKSDFKTQTHSKLAGSIKKGNVALAGVAQWTGCQPADQKATGLIPSQGTRLGCKPGPWLGVWERQLIDLSLSHWSFPPSLPPFPCL